MSRRFLIASLTCSALLVPGVAFGLLMSPSSVLEVLQQNRGPQRFTAQGYVNTPDGSVNAMMSINGAFEGKTPETLKMKMDASFAVTADGEAASGMLRIVAQGTKMYVQIAEASGAWQIDTNMLGDWYVVDLDEEIDRHDASIESMVADGDFTEEDMRQLVRVIHDSVFQMESSLFEGGASYKLTLRHDFLLSLARNVCASDIIDCENDLGFGSIAEIESELMEMQRELGDKLNVSYKVDTDRANNLQFARMYVSLSWPEMVSFSFQGEVHNQTTPVYLEVPRDAKPIEELVENGMLHQGDMHWIDRSPEWTDEDWSEDDWSDIEWEDADWSSDEWDDIEWEEEDDSAWDDMEWEELPVGCTAEPGTAQYLQQARKGECPLPEEIRPGRGDLRRLR